jgi:hypothetical protein
MSENQTQGYIDLTKIPRFSNYHIHHNADCVKCRKLEKEMIRVGAVIFCSECVDEEFSTKDPVTEERERYLHWLRVGYKRLEESE